MNEKEETKYEIIEKVVNGILTRSEAEEKLELSKRQVNRLILKYKIEGKDGFIHKGKGKTNAPKTDNYLKEKIVNLYLNEYFDYNFSHFYEDAIKGKYKIDISFVNVVNILTKENIISPLARHKTVNEYNRQMREEMNKGTISEEIQELYETRLLREEQAHTRKSTLHYKFGEELQMDAAEYTWFCNIVTFLHLVVDKATKRVLFGWFDTQETMRAYFVLLFNVIYMYGIPRKIRTDKRKVFYNDDGDLTHFGKSCEKLGIQLDSSSNPRFKPNVERENHTFENRLKAELRHEGITTIEEANKYLNDIFIPKMNSKFAFPIDKKNNLMRENKYTIEELTLIISERYPRIIDSGSCIKYNTKYYIPIDKDNKEVYFKNKTPVIIIIDYNYELRCLIEQKYYKLKEIKKQEYNPALAAQEIEDSWEKSKKQYIPPENHPWRKFKI